MIKLMLGDYNESEKKLLFYLFRHLCETFVESPYCNEVCKQCESIKICRDIHSTKDYLEKEVYKNA